MKSNLWPVLKREYLTRVRTKAFWISTLLFPIIFGGMMVVPSILAARSKARPEPIRIVDAVGDFFPVLEAALAEDARATSRPPIEREDPGGRDLAEVRQQLNNDAEAGLIQGYVIVDDEAIESGEITYYAKSPSSALGEGWLSRRLRDAVSRYRLTRIGLEESQIATAMKNVDVDVRKATNDPARQDESGEAAFFVSLVMVMFIYGTLIIYGMYVLRGVLEEKSNRIVEVIVSSVKPFHLMLGKIVGIGAVGLTQIVIWVIFGLAITAPQAATAMAISPEAMPRLEPMTLVFFPVFFVLGYFLFATIYAGIGSMFNSEEDAQQLASVAVMFLVVPMVMLMPVMRNPNGTLAVVLSLIPFFAPILMYLRIAVELPPMWQIGLSIGILVGTIFVMTWIVAKIYRVGILMYGKKPTIPEVIRWLRYS